MYGNPYVQKSGTSSFGSECGADVGKWFGEPHNLPRGVNEKRPLIVLVQFSKAAAPATPKAVRRVEEAVDGVYRIATKACEEEFWIDEVLLSVLT